MYTCAQCAVLACCEETPKALPKNCPMREEAFFEEAFPCYEAPENSRFYITASEIEGLGYGEWPRLRETMELCQRMGWTRIGMAFCKGLHSEAKIIDKVLRRCGLEVVSVMCKTGGIPKERAGIAKERKLRPDAFEPMCNPIAQAMLLNRQKTQFNIVVGLCVGHDSLFLKYADALSTVLIAKDRVLAHNPAGAVYCAEGYLKNRLSPDPPSGRP